MATYVFGYGSLINKNELIKEFSKHKEFSKKKKVIPVIVSGLKRVFNVSVSGGAYKVLGVKESSSSTAECNGVLVKVNEVELAALIERESNYTMKTIKKDRISFPYGKKTDLKKEDQILCFYPELLFKLTKTQSERIPIRPNYLNICLEGAKSFGKDFLHDFIETTSGVQTRFL
jgi:hypothetical protein